MTEADFFGIKWIQAQWLVYLGDIQLGPTYTYPLGLLYVDFIVLIITLAYVFYPLKYLKTKTFQQNIGKLTVEYEYIIRIIFIEMPVLVVATSFVLIYTNFPELFPRGLTGHMALFFYQSIAIFNNFSNWCRNLVFFAHFQKRI